MSATAAPPTSTLGAPLIEFDAYGNPRLSFAVWRRVISLTIFGSAQPPTSVFTDANGNPLVDAAGNLIGVPPA
jgi:hypothetical protein